VLTQEELKSSGVRTINEAIMKLGGLIGRPSLYGGNEYTIDLGGFGEAAASNMVYVIDGVVFKHGDGSEIRIGNISLDEVERIEIQRGGSAVLFGEGAVGGVINIVTHASGLSTTAQNKGKIETGFGSYGNKEVKANANFVKNGVNLWTSGAKSQADGFRSNSASHSDNTSLGLQFVGDKSRLGTNFSNNNEFAQTPGSLTISEYQANRNQADATNQSLRTLIDSNSKHYGLFTETDIAGILWRTDIKRRDRDYYFLDSNSGAASTATFNTQNYTYTSTVTQGLPTLWGKYSYVIGLEKIHWTQSRVTSDFGDYNNNADSKSAFVKNDIDISDFQTRLTWGYRTETMNKYSVGYKSNEFYQSRQSMNASEIGASKQIFSNQSLWVKFSKNYRLPNIDEFSNAYNDSYDFVTLLPQTSTDKEVGWHFLKGTTQADVRVFQSNLLNEIAYDASASAKYGSNVNLDPTKRQGIEASFKQEMTKEFDVGGFAAYRKSNFVSGDYVGKNIPLAPQNIFSVRANWRFVANQSLGLNTTYTGKQQIGSDFSNSNQTPAYTVTDIFYRYLSSQWEMQLAVRNAFDTSYYSYATDAYESQTTRYTAIYPDMKRNFFVNFKYFLK
jgi:iron complex outermembrane receptor protein